MRNIHVYAPGKHTYQVVNVEVASRPWLRVKPTSYPPSTIYHFKPLDERVAVYSKPFQLDPRGRDPVEHLRSAESALTGRTTVMLDATLGVSGLRRQDLLHAADRAAVVDARGLKPGLRT